MNGAWYSWGSDAHVAGEGIRGRMAAHRHLFRAVRKPERDLAVDGQHRSTERSMARSSPARWWPGSSYVNWVGIDGYYYKPSWTFAPLFGPTIMIVHALSRCRSRYSSPRQARAPNAGQPAKIADLFAGIRTYGLLGFVWFDAVASKDYPINGQAVIDFRINGPAAIAAFRQAAKTYSRPAS